MATREELLARRDLLLRKKELLQRRQELSQPKPSSLIPEPLSQAGRAIEEATPTGARPALTGAREALRGAATAVVPGGITTIEQPELAARTALSIVRPIPTAVGLGAKALARTGKGRELIGRTREKLAETTPVTIPGIIQKGFAKATPKEEFQEFGETIAEAGGFLGAEGLGAKLPVIRQNIGQLSKTLTRFSLFKDPEFVLRQSEGITKAAKSLENEAGKAVRELMAGEIGNKPVDIQKASEAIKTLPKNVVGALGDPERTALFKIEFERDGSLKATARNMWNVRRFLDNFLTSKDFFDAGKVEKQVILNARRSLAALLRGVDKSVAPIMDKFSKITKAADRIRSVTTTKGEIVANKLQNLFTSKGEPGIRKFFTQLQESAPEIQTMVNDVIKFNRGQLLKKFGIGAAVATGAGVLFRRPITRAVEGLGGGGEAIPTQTGPR